MNQLSDFGEQSRPTATLTDVTKLVGMPIVDAVIFLISQGYRISQEPSEYVVPMIKGRTLVIVWRSLEDDCKNVVRITEKYIPTT